MPRLIAGREIQSCSRAVGKVGLPLLLIILAALRSNDDRIEAGTLN